MRDVGWEKLDIPAQDMVLIARLAAVISNRLANRADPPETRRTLLRLLFCLQRCPRFIPGLNISLSIDRYQLLVNDQQIGFFWFTEDGHTMLHLQYFQDHSHCLYGYEFLDGEERIEAAILRIDEFESHMEVADNISIEDYSVDRGVDDPPIVGVWSQ
jgi:hypothetical protein